MRPETEAFNKLSLTDLVNLLKNHEDYHKLALELLKLAAQAAQIKGGGAYVYEKSSLPLKDDSLREVAINWEYYEIFLVLDEKIRNGVEAPDGSFIRECQAITNTLGELPNRDKIIGQVDKSLRGE